MYNYAFPAFLSSEASKKRSWCQQFSEDENSNLSKLLATSMINDFNPIQANHWVWKALGGSLRLFHMCIGQDCYVVMDVRKHTQLVKIGSCEGQARLIVLLMFPSFQYYASFWPVYMWNKRSSWLVFMRRLTFNNPVIYRFRWFAPFLKKFLWSRKNG